MGIFDKAREALGEHADKVDPLADRLPDQSDKPTAGRRGAKIDRAADLVEDKLGDQARSRTTPEPGTPG